MKTWSVNLVLAAAMGLGAPMARGVLPSDPSRPDLDRRAEALENARAKSASARGLAQRAAEEVLRNRLSGARVSRDRITGSPRHITAGRGFLTGPGGHGGAVSKSSLEAFPASDHARVIKAFLNEHSAVFGHDASALDSARVRQDDVTQHNGLRTLIWEQTLDGIPVFEALLKGHITWAGELVNLSSHFILDPAKAVQAGALNRNAAPGRPGISAVKALVLAAADLGVTLDEEGITMDEGPVGAEQKQTLYAGPLAGPAWAQQYWVPMDADTTRLCWQVFVTARLPKMERYQMLMDARTGEVILRRNVTVNISPATYNIFPSDSPSPFSPGSATPTTFQPPVTNRTMVTLSALDTNASPLGWINDGQTRTVGNNATAYLDRDYDLVADVPQPQATGTNRVFDFPLNLTSQPAAYADASTVQLFYRANWYHDRLYRLGFTEAAGNYQSNNFARGGFGRDAVICLVQAGADVGASDNAIFMGSPDGYAGVVSMFVWAGPNPDRDGSLDQEIVIHELTHGLSGRLVGGGIGISQLQSRGLGEGWSDFYALCLLSQSSDDLTGNYAMAGYATYREGGYNFEQNYYFGIRRYPYSTEMTRSPLTFKDIDPTQADPHVGVPVNPLSGGSYAALVHNQGEVWCVTLREIWASLVAKSGWSLGNEVTLQLVTDGMKLGPANPTFLESRDAIINADLAYTGGANYDEIWIAFAKRGMGASAISPPNFTTVGVVEAFDVPPDVFVGVEVPIGLMRVRVTPTALTALYAGDTNSIFLRITDGPGVTNATIVASTTTGTNLIFRNNGVPPDLLTNDQVYSASLRVPTTGDSVTINMVITAPGKDPSTNSVTYLIVPTPSNDHFTNSLKVPVTGDYYLANNRRATTEMLEPDHDSVPSADHSLWWKYTATSSTNVLVDSGGSDFRAIVAVYTNTTLATLQPVASAAGGVERFGPFVRFNTTAGTTYHVAVAGFDDQTFGTLRLLVTPGGVPDTNGPAVTVTNPISGIIVTTNRLTMSGTAVEPTPNAAGIRHIIISVTPVTVAGPTTTTFVSPVENAVGPLSTNWSAIVGLLPGDNSIRVVAEDFAGNLSTPVVVQATYRSPDPLNDFLVRAFALPGSNGVSSVNTLNATKEVGEPDHAGNAGGRSVWWSFTPSQDGVLTLSTSNSTFDTVLAVYTGTSVTNLTPVGSNDEAYSGASGGFSALSQAVRAGQTYRIAVDGYEGAGGAMFLTSSFAAATVYHVTAGGSAGGTATPASADVASNATLVVTAVPDANYLFDIWGGSIVSLANPLTLVVRSDLTLTAQFTPVTYSDGFESGDLLHLGWNTAGEQPWIVQTNVASIGQFAARSGAITHNQTSSLILTGNFRNDTASFDFKVSCEPVFDALWFYVDGVLQQQWTGELGWANYALPLAAGTHTLEWRYLKDASGSAGLDAGFIDNVILPFAVAVDGSTPAHLSLARQSDGSYYINLTGQVGQTYVTQVSSDLINWQSLSTDVATDGTARVADPASATNAPRFYRAIVPVP